MTRRESEVLATNKRISDEPSFVLHRYDWSETSLILEVFTRHHGRMALVAKGVKRPSSNLRPVLLPLQPLQVSFGGDAEIRTLKSAEWVGGHVMPTGAALLSGYYLNELLLQILAREDPHPNLFDTYRQLVKVLAAGGSEVLQPALRAFELLLLRDVGLLPVLDLQTLTLAPLAAQTRYILLPEGGLCAASAHDRYAMEAGQWMALQAALAPGASLPELLKLCATFLPELKPQLRALLHYHCGVPILRTRQLMVDIQNL
jgi:DNA repair protein RecO (recombination protein O)